MKNQRRTAENKRFNLCAVLAFMLVFFTLAACFTVTSFAADNSKVVVKWEDLKITDDANKYTDGDSTWYTKVYDGSTTVNVDALAFADAAKQTPYADPDVKIVIDTVTLSDANAGNVRMTITFALENNDAGIYQAPSAITVPAVVTPARLAWEDDAEIAVNLDFVYNESTYAGMLSDYGITKEQIEELLKDDITYDATLALDPAAIDVTVTGANKPGTYTVQATVKLGQNYTVAKLPVKVTLNPITIAADGVQFSQKDLVFFYGDSAIHSIVATVKDSIGGVWTQEVEYWVEKDGVFEKVDRIDGNVTGSYWISIPKFSKLVDFAGSEIWTGTQTMTSQIITCPEGDANAWTDGQTRVWKLTINPKKINLTMNDATFVGEEDQTSGDNTPKYMLGVKPTNGSLPQSVLNSIRYFSNGELFNGTSAYGETSITAVIPVDPNYEFCNSKGTALKVEQMTIDGKKVEVVKLYASLFINQLYVAGGSEENKIDVIVWGEGDGFADNVTVEVTVPTIDSALLQGKPLHTEFTVALKGDINDGDSFILLIPVTEALYSANATPLTVDDLYIFDSAIGELVKVNGSELYTVTLKDGHYVVEGYTGANPVTFVIAPEYNTPFFLTAPGIALIVLIVIAVILALFFIGLKLRRIAAEREENDAVAVATADDTAESEPVLVDGTVAPIVNVDELKIPEEEPAPVEDARDERTNEAVEDSLEVLTNEAAEIELPREDLSKADEATDALAEKLRGELVESVAADDGVNRDADADEVKAAVADAMDQALNESADASDAIEVVVEEEAPVEEPAPVEEEAPVEETVEAFAAVAEEPAEESDDDDDDDDDDNDDDGSFGFNTAGLKFIDTKAEAEAYEEMLAQERDGLIKIVYRYRRSFASRMAQSQGSVQDYYNAIKTLLLSYKGVKSRISWNYDAFNRGRTHVAKINAKTKTLYLYLALDPAELADTKYGIKDMSSKKKYASVPVLMKIKGDRKFKYALELIEKLCGENLALKPLENIEEVDYRMPYKTTEELVEEGTIKMFAAAISMAPAAEEAPVVEEAPAEEAVAVDAVVEETNTDETV